MLEVTVKFITLLLLTTKALCIGVPEDYKYDECTPEKTVCEYWLRVKEQLTMIYEKDLVYADKGKLYKYNEDPSSAKTKIPIDKVVSVDGVNRMAIAVNGSIPGPPIVVYEGQTLIVHVRNLLLSDSVSIHWHGLHQKGTPFMDGVGYISQCPIAAGQTFTYRFKAEPKGTFWYHSHVGAQRTNGVFGALIIKESPKPSIEYPTDVIMTVGDWHHHSSEEVYVKMVYGNFIGRKKFQTTSTVDGGKFSGVPWVSGIIEGKGRYYNPQTDEQIEAPLTLYKVKKGKKYRFRVIHIGTIYPLRVSVDGHSIDVVASDGYDIKPVTVESFIINPGERYDFLFVADKQPGNYWLRANSLEFGVKHHTIEAIIRYEGAADVEPTTKRKTCTQQSKCTVANCPFNYFPPKENIKCMIFSEFQNADSSDKPPAYIKGDSEEHFLNFAFPGTNVTPGAVNGRKFEFPGVSSLTQDDDIGDFDCKKHDCGVDKVCYCHYELKIPYNKTIQMVWVNKGSGAGWGHPIHLHGHSFYVMKMAFSPQNASTGKLLLDENGKFVEHADVGCDNGKHKFCNEPEWADASWKHGKVPGMNEINPPRKDTLIIPTGGYAVIRIRSNNPGKWFMHCHIEVHALDGMAMVLTEAIDQVPKPPKGFPICNNFYNDHSRDLAFSKYGTPTPTNNDCDNKQQILFIIIGIMAAIIVFLLVIVTCFCIRRTTNQVKIDESAYPMKS